MKRKASKSMVDWWYSVSNGDVVMLCRTLQNQLDKALHKATQAEQKASTIQSGISSVVKCCGWPSIYPIVFTV